MMVLSDNTCRREYKLLRSSYSECCSQTIAGASTIVDLLLVNPRPIVVIQRTGMIDLTPVVSSQAHAHPTDLQAPQNFRTNADLYSFTKKKASR